MSIAPSVAATTTNNTVVPTHIEACDHIDNPLAFGRDEITVHTNKECTVLAHIFENGAFIPMKFKWIHYELSNSNGTIIQTGKEMTDGGSMWWTCFFIKPAFFKLGKLPVGEYTLKAFYNGNETDNLAPSEKYVKIHVLPVKQIPTYIELYDYSSSWIVTNNSSNVPAIKDGITIFNTTRCVVVARLFSTLHKPLALRVIHYELSNSNGTIIQTGDNVTHTSIPNESNAKVPPAFFNLGKLPVGTYTLKAFYIGNKKDKLAPSEKYIKIRVVRPIIF